MTLTAEEDLYMITVTKMNANGRLKEDKCISGSGTRKRESVDEPDGHLKGESSDDGRNLNEGLGIDSFYRPCVYLGKACYQAV
jgi:hypothetical protein